MKLEINYVCSNLKQRCQKCGQIFPAREESIKVVKTLRGRTSLMETYYTCLACAAKGAYVDERGTSVQVRGAK